MANETVGVIGLGLMGTAVTRRLLAAGCAVIGYDVDADKRARFAALGARAVESVADVARACRVSVLCVFNYAQVSEVVEGEAGLIASTPKAGEAPVAVCTTTVEPEPIASLAERARAKGFVLLEVPISGTSSQVARGDGVGLVAGDEATAARVGQVLDAICPRRHFLGAPGNGARAKLAINLILGLTRAAIAEGLVLAERLGLDPARFLDVARASAAYSQAMDVKGPIMVSGDFASPISRVDQSLKDFRMIVAQAESLGQTLPVASLYVELMQGCVANGEAALDNAIVINEIRRRRTG